MDETTKSRRGGSRPGAGRPRNKLQRGDQLSPEALEFSADAAHNKLITGTALDIASWFNDPGEQIEVIKLAIKLRAGGKRLTHATALKHLSESRGK